MQSRFALTAFKFNRRTLFAAERIRGCGTTSGRTADPAEHAVDEEDVYPTEAMQEEKLRRPPKHEPTSKVDESYIPPRSPTDTAPKVESIGVAPRIDPTGQQKRHSSAAVTIDDGSCAAIDGSPWPAEADETDMKGQREEQEKDNKEMKKEEDLTAG